MMKNITDDVCLKHLTYLNCHHHVKCFYDVLHYFPGVIIIGAGFFGFDIIISWAIINDRFTD